MGNDAENVGAGGVATAAEAVPESGYVPFFSQARTFERLWPTIAAKIDEVFENGEFSHGRQVAELEERLAEYTGARFAIGVSSGTDALVLLLRASGLQPGDEVIVPAYSCASTAASVALAGATPVFADIDPNTYALDPAKLARVRSERTKFAMPAHLFSRMADMSGLAHEANRLGITLLEDSAEAIGMRQRGVHAGLHGSGGVLSFFPSTTLGAIGDAGAVLTDDPAVAELVAGLRHHGRFGRTPDHSPGISTGAAACGTNSEMDDVQAAVLLAKLTVLDEDIRRRELLAARYRERLADVPGVLRLPAPATADESEDRVFYAYLVEVEHRDELVAHLERCGIGTETYYPVPLHRQPRFAGGGYVRGDFPRAEAAAEHAVALPLYPDLDESDVDRVCAAVHDFRLGRLSA